MYRGAFYRGGPVLNSAISGVEQALWDISGKALGVPAYALLGGKCRDRIRVYAHVGGDTAAEIGDSARARLTQGFDAFKIGVFGALRIVETPNVLREAVTKLEAIRDAVGWDMDIAVDFHGRVSPAMAVRAAKAFEPLDLMFIEEPCLPENVDTMVTIARSTSIPVATGERLFTKWGFREVLEKQAAVILQPDVSHAGGIYETIKIGAMAESYYAAMAPHCPLGPIALAACLQADAALPQFPHPGAGDAGRGLSHQAVRGRAGVYPLAHRPGAGHRDQRRGCAPGPLRRFLADAQPAPRRWLGGRLVEGKQDLIA